jgi:molybdenum cofactor cytidylyltransferase
MLLIPALRLNADPGRPDVVTIVGGGGKTSLLFRLAQEIVAQGGRVVTATTTRITVGQVARAPAHLRVPAGAPLPAAAVAEALDAHRHVMLVGDETLLNGKQAGIEAALIDALAAQAPTLGIAAILIEGDGSRTLPVKAPAAHEPVVAPSTMLLLPVIGMEAVGAPLDEAHAHRPERIRALLGIEETPAGTLRLTPAHAARLLLHAEGGAKGLPPGARLLPVLNKADTAPRLAAARWIAAQVAAQGHPALIAAAGQATQEPVIERWGPTAALVLAAGESRRFGRPKQAEPVAGEAMARRAARLALASGAAQVILVTGAHAEATQAAVADLDNARLRLVHNPDWAAGQSTSLQAGLAALGPEVEALLCLPVDQPFLESALLRRLFALWRRGANLAAPEVEGELRGAPALFDRRFFSALAAVQGDQGGRSVLQAHAAAAARLPVAPALLRDVDRPGDLVV